MSLVPTFARIEIRMTDKGDIKKAAGELARLAETLASIGTGGLTDDLSLLAGYAAIKDVSQQLRGTEK